MTGAALNMRRLSSGSKIELRSAGRLVLQDLEEDFDALRLNKRMTNSLPAKPAIVVYPSAPDRSVTSLLGSAY